MSRLEVSLKLFLLMWWKYWLSVIDKLDKNIDTLKEQNFKIRKKFRDLKESAPYHNENIDES